MKKNPKAIINDLQRQTAGVSLKSHQSQTTTPTPAPSRGTQAIGAARQTVQGSWLEALNSFVKPPHQKEQPIVGEELERLLRHYGLNTEDSAESGFYIDEVAREQAKLEAAARRKNAATHASLARLVSPFLEYYESKEGKAKQQWEEKYREGVYSWKDLMGERIVDTTTGKHEFIPSAWLPLFSTGTFLNNEYPNTGNPDDDPPWGLPTADKIIRTCINLGICPECISCQDDDDEEVEEGVHSGGSNIVHHPCQTKIGDMLVDICKEKVISIKGSIYKR